jgi:hypothetical protein
MIRRDGVRAGPAAPQRPGEGSRTVLAPERVLRLHRRTLVLVLATPIAAEIVIWLVLATHRIIVWLPIAPFLTVAIHPLVALLERRGVHPHGAAVLLALLISAGGGGRPRLAARPAPGRPGAVLHAGVWGPR